MELYLLIACVILSAAAAVFAALSLKRASREREGEEALRAELAQLRAMRFAGTKPGGAAGNHEQGRAGHA